MIRGEQKKPHGVIKIGGEDNPSGRIAIELEAKGRGG